MTRRVIIRIAVRTAAVFTAQATAWQVLRWLDHVVPEYHAFWSGAVLWAVPVALFAVPALTTRMLLRGVN